MLVLAPPSRRFVDQVVDALHAFEPIVFVGLGAYGMDSHNCQRIVKGGRVENEGDVQVGGFPPYPSLLTLASPFHQERWLSRLCAIRGKNSGE